MSSDPKKFAPNIANCRSRKSSKDHRPRFDSSSSDEISLLGVKNHEFTFGPDLFPQKRIKPTQLSQSGKNLDIHFASDMVCEEVGIEDDDYIHLARSISEQNGGVCLSETCENENFPLLFKCKMGHIWESSEVLLSHSWCWKCKNLLDRAKDFASSYGGRCLSTACELLLDFECRSGHRWKSDLMRYMHQKWCKQCAAEEKNEKKLRLIREKRTEEEEQARLQEKLFEEARQKMQVEVEVNVESEREVEVMAEEMARRFLENSMSSDRVSSEQVSCVYQVTCASEQYLRGKYFNRSRDFATSCFRQLARLLHPDKNKHPLAAEAFLKISSTYAAAMANA